MYADFVIIEGEVIFSEKYRLGIHCLDWEEEVRYRATHAGTLCTITCRPSECMTQEMIQSQAAAEIKFQDQ